MRAVGTPGSEIRRRVPALLRTVSMDAKQKHFPRELSGGEQQRVALARAIANNPDMLWQIEVTSGVLSDECSAIFKDFFKKIRTEKQKKKVIV